MTKRTKDIDLINEAYTNQVQQVDEWMSAAIQGAKALAPELGKQALKTGATVGATNIANKVTKGGHNGQPGQAPPEQLNASAGDNITDLHDGDMDNLSNIKKDSMIQTIIDSLEELIKGNTGPDSPCGEQEALELVEKHCRGRLDEMIPALGMAAASAIPAGVDAVKSMLPGGDK